jgi:hypothetical protein
MFSRPKFRSRPQPVSNLLKRRLQFAQEWVLTFDIDNRYDISNGQTR